MVTEEERFLPMWVRGLIIGISIAAPVGPIGVLCIRRTLADGRIAGFVSGLGAATADAIYGSIAGFGLTFISGFLVAQRNWLGLFGGLFLCYLGIRTMIASPSQDDLPDGHQGLAGKYLSTFFLTLTNPLTILSFAAIFAGLGLVDNAGDYKSAGMLVLGVFCGSALWWLLLSSGVSLFRSRLAPSGMVWINRAAGLIIFIFGVAALGTLLFPL